MFHNAQINASTQNHPVNPRNVFRTNIPAKLLCFRIAATIVGRKYTSMVRITATAIKNIDTNPYATLVSLSAVRDRFIVS